MTPDQTAIERLRAHGYSAFQTCFLWLVTLHSGLFPRRQYLQLAVKSSGEQANSFLGKLTVDSHCRTFPLVGKIVVCLLYSRVIYRAVGQTELCFRRPHGHDYVTSKPLSFDFVLRNPHNKYPATEEKKVSCLSPHCGVPTSKLLGKIHRLLKERAKTVRCFVDRSLSFSRRTFRRDLWFISVWWVPGVIPALQKHSTEPGINGGKLRMQVLRVVFRTMEERWRRLRLRPTRKSRPKQRSLTLQSENWGENRMISCFHRSFHPCFHPLHVDKCPQIREKACGRRLAGNKRGDGERAVATPLFHGEKRSKCRAGSVEVSPPVRVATARSPDRQCKTNV
jgi:hypothetical protein